MRELDLIPRDYRERLAKEHWLKLSGAAAILVLMLVVSSYGMLRHLTGVLNAEVRALQTKKDISSRQRRELQRLRARKEELDQQLRLLTNLRSGVAAERMLLTVDRALDGGELWFLNWQFQRSGAAVQGQEKPPQTGYFVLTPKDGTGAAPDAWRIETHMKIKGQALDHAALAGFVTRLIDRPEIQDVRVLSTVLRPGQGRSVVDFDLAVTVAAGSG